MTHPLGTCGRYWVRRGRRGASVVVVVSGSVVVVVDSVVGVSPARPSEAVSKACEASSPRTVTAPMARKATKDDDHGVFDDRCSPLRVGHVDWYRPAARRLSRKTVAFSVAPP